MRYELEQLAIDTRDVAQYFASVFTAFLRLLSMLFDYRPYLYSLIIVSIVLAIGS